jgi:ferredoxin
MGQIIAGNRSATVSDGGSIIAACEELGVPFGCQSGNCGTCLTVVLDGMENLSSPSPEENDFGLNAEERLMCQCRITGNSVTIQL